MAEYLPVRSPGQALTLTASATITAGQLLIVSGSGTVAPSSAASQSWLGVAGNDAASGDQVTVWCGGTQELTTPAGVTAGQTVEAAASGGVATHTLGTNDGNIVGVAITTAGAAAKTRVQLLR